MKSRVDHQAELVAVLREPLRHVERGALLDVLQNLRVARLIADDQQPAAGFLHRLQRFVVGGDARRAGPGEVRAASASRRARSCASSGS